MDCLIYIFHLVIRLLYSTISVVSSHFLVSMHAQSSRYVNLEKVDCDHLDKTFHQSSKRLLQYLGIHSGASFGHCANALFIRLGKPAAS